MSAPRKLEKGTGLMVCIGLNAARATATQALGFVVMGLFSVVVVVF